MDTFSFTFVYELDGYWQVNMDDPNIIMEEYIRLEEEKAHKRGKVYNWETAKYGKTVIMKSLVMKKQKGAILELKRRHLKKVPKIEIISTVSTRRYALSAALAHHKNAFLSIPYTPY
ncbi:hypothetical protein Tco_0268778 [Tanacetum coccineum]